MTEKLLKLKQSLGSVTLVPASGGRFEISMGDEMIYSKLKTGEFPDHEAIVRLVRSRLK